MSQAMNELPRVLRQLRLSGVLATLDIRIRQAVEEPLPPSEFLYRVLQDELERRAGKQLEQRLRRASFEQTKTLDELDFTFNPKLPKTQLLELGTCQFIERKEPVHLIGPAGVGKSHVAQALGHRACRLGKSVLFTNAGELLATLRASRADNSYERKLTKYIAPELLIIDDLGLRPLRGDEPHDLYEVIRRRHQKGALVITSNRAMEEWPPLFGDPLLASSAMDRLLQDAHILVLEGSSYRNPPKSR